MGHAHDLPEAIELSALGQSVCVQFTTNDDRQLQVRFEEDGRIIIRGWGNIAAKLGNADQVKFMATIALEEQTTCPSCFGKVGKCSCERVI